jgi:hypothetical protein
MLFQGIKVEVLIRLILHRHLILEFLTNFVVKVIKLVRSRATKRKLKRFVDLVVV